MNSSITVPVPETSSPDDDVARPGSTGSPTSLNPVPALPPSFLHAEEEICEVVGYGDPENARCRQALPRRKRILAAPERSRSSNTFPKQLTSTKQISHHGQVKEEGEEWDNLEGESLCFLKKKASAEQAGRQQRIAAIESFLEHNLTAPNALDVQIIEDRIDKARSDLSTLEQHTRQIETEMQTLQAELAKLKDQLCRTQFHKAIP